MTDPRAVKKYSVTRPRATHWDVIGCKEHGCIHWTEGWISLVPTDSPQAHYIRTGSGRKFREKKVPGHGEGTPMSEFLFWPEQECFAEHIRPRDMVEVYKVGTVDGVRRHASPEDWTEDIVTHMDNLRRVEERG